MLIIAAATASGVGPVVLVYPSGPVVPENLLRIELRFSSPLRPPLTIDQVKLMDGNGREIKDPFLDLPLPSRDDNSVTILFHPGRVKSGVGANLALGRALRAGTTVTLVVDHPAFMRPVRKSWQVTAFDGKPPHPDRWTFALPQRGSRSDLVLHLDKPISSTAERLIAIRGPDGNRLEGVACLESGETIWRFTPSSPWQVGSYAVVTHPDLEDLAGNRPCAPFEAVGESQVRDDAGTVEKFELPE